jgi:hypothetical protein
MAIWNMKCTFEQVEMPPKLATNCGCAIRTLIILHEMHVPDPPSMRFLFYMLSHYDWLQQFVLIAK